jgi:hypothetical protein
LFLWPFLLTSLNFFTHSSIIARCHVLTVSPKSLKRNLHNFTLLSPASLFHVTLPFQTLPTCLEAGLSSALPIDLPTPLQLPLKNLPTCLAAGSSQNPRSTGLPSSLLTTFQPHSLVTTLGVESSQAHLSRKA